MTVLTCMASVILILAWTEGIYRCLRGHKRQSMTVIDPGMLRINSCLFVFVDSEIYCMLFSHILIVCSWTWSDDGG